MSERGGAQGGAGKWWVQGRRKEVGTKESEVERVDSGAIALKEKKGIKRGGVGGSDRALSSLVKILQEADFCFE